MAIGLLFFGDEIEEIESIDVVTSKRSCPDGKCRHLSANLYVAPKDILQQVLCMRYRMK
ncbi:MAG: hypothetical protein IPN56_15895 [Chitinophagaceae bacterium]|nr:hypothetical protein [Chitinophagaceae bacterium]